MTEYHKIQTVFKRNPKTNFKTLLEGEYSLLEFSFLKDNRWVFTEKVDGTNIRVSYHNKQIHFAGRTDKAEIPPFLLQSLEEEFIPRISLFESVFGAGSKVCFYGEGYGEKIQKVGKLYRKGHGFVLFDINIDGLWLEREDVEALAEKFSIEIVPIIGDGTLNEMVNLARKGFSSTWGDFPAEGIVARPAIELRGRRGYRIITKIKCKDFSNVGRGTNEQ